MKVVTQVKTAYKETKQLVASLEHFVEAVSLLILAYAGYYTAFNLDSLEKHEQIVLLFAAIVVGLRGSVEFLKSIGSKK